MMANVGSIDRILRVLVGLALIGYVILGAVPYTTVGLGMILLIVGAVLVLTGLVRFCPAYRLIGVSTCSRA